MGDIQSAPGSIEVVIEIYPKELHGTGIMGVFSGSCSVTGQGQVRLGLV